MRYGRLRTDANLTGDNEMFKIKPISELDVVSTRRQLMEKHPCNLDYFSRLDVCQEGNGFYS
jgi:hypothetical protein